MSERRELDDLIFQDTFLGDNMRNPNTVTFCLTSTASPIIPHNTPVIPTVPIKSPRSS